MTAEGILVGSVITMGRAFANLLSAGGLCAEKASRCVSANPARMLGLDNLGRIASRCRARLTAVAADGGIRGVVWDGVQGLRD